MASVVRMRNYEELAEDGTRKIDFTSDDGKKEQKTNSLPAALHMTVFKTDTAGVTLFTFLRCRVRNCNLF